jgi:hypothetical protein
VASEAVPAGSVVQIVRGLIKPGAVQAKLGVIELYKAYAAACAETGKRPVAPVEFPAALVPICEACGITIRDDGAAGVFLLKVRLSQTTKAVVAGLNFSQQRLLWGVEGHGCMIERRVNVVYNSADGILPMCDSGTGSVCSAPAWREVPKREFPFRQKGLAREADDGSGASWKWLAMHYSLDLQRAKCCFIRSIENACKLNGCWG